jgi:hypothetical protein
VIFRHPRKARENGRQARTGALMFTVLAMLFAAGLYLGFAEVQLHGMRFFVFRENGAGASETGVTDSQFPGHPGSPGRR